METRWTCKLTFLQVDAISSIILVDQTLYDPWKDSA